MSLPCISTALNAVGLGILIDLLQKKTLTLTLALTLTNNANPLMIIQLYHFISVSFQSKPNPQLGVALHSCVL